ncbi:hypothetical protein ACHAXT_009607 [Thalassiosira profunda]
MRCGLADLARLFCFLRRTRANRDRTPEPESSRAKVAPTPGAQQSEDREWEERYSELEASEKSRAKSASTDDDADVDYPCPLRMWLYKQRFLYDNNFLDRDRVDKLQALGVFRDKPLGTPSPESGTASTLSATDYGDEAAVDASYEEPSRIGTSSTISATDYGGDEGEEKNRFES